MKIIKFLALILTALALVPSGAHVLELSHKIDMSRTDYLTVQGLYRGWWMMGLVFIAALLADGALAIRTRDQTQPFLFALGAAGAMAASLIIFFVWTYPVNTATANWSLAPDHWQRFRDQWEYSHAANAAVTFVALCFVVFAVLSGRSAARARG